MNRKVMLLPLIICCFAKSEATLHENQQSNILSKVEHLISIVIDKYIPNEESITLYYDGEWAKNQQVTPGDILRQKSSEYRKWITKTYFNEDEVPYIINNIDTEDVNVPLKEETVYENMVIYCNCSHFMDDENNTLYQITIQKKAIIYLSGINGEELSIKLSSVGLIDKVVPSLYFLRRLGFILLARSGLLDEIFIYNFYHKSNYGQELKLRLLDRWDLTAERFKIGANLFPKLRPHVWEKPFIAHMVLGNTPYMINDDKAKIFELSSPAGAGVEVLKIIIEKAFSANNYVCLPIPPAPFSALQIRAEAFDVFLNAGSPKYFLIPNYDISNYIEFENVSVVLINSTDAEVDDKNVININLYVVLGAIIIVLVTLVASKVVSKYFRIQEFDDNLFVALTWSTFLGVSVPNQPAGYMRIVFIGFVFLSFFIVTLYSQYLYTELATESPVLSKTIEELENEGYKYFPDYIFVKYFHKEVAEINRSYTLPGKRYALVNTDDLKSFIDNVTYTVLKEHFIRPRFIYTKKSVPIELVNKIIMLTSQSGVYEKWRRQYQHQLELNEDEEEGEEQEEGEEEYEEEDDYDDYEDEEDMEYEEYEEYEDYVQPIYLSDLYGPIIVVYSLFVCSLITLIIEMIVDKMNTRNQQRRLHARRPGAARTRNVAQVRTRYLP